jgi:hypothetical protein
LLKATTISKKAINVLLELSPETKQFYLARGTALALYYQHRSSFDLDYFTDKRFDNIQLSKKLSLKGFEPENIRLSQGTLEFQLRNVKVSFFEFPYKVLDNFNYYNSVKIASVTDISAMKLVAIASRAEKKDYYDLVEVLTRNKFKTTIEAFQRKFGKHVDLYHIVKALCYFEDVEDSPDPLNAKLSWQEVKNYLSKNCRNYLSIIEKHFLD